MAEQNFKVKDIKTELGVSIEVNGTWYRLGCSMTQEADGKGAVTVRELNEVFAKGWSKLEAEISAQVKELK